MNQTALNSNVENTLALTKPLNISDDEPNIGIQYSLTLKTLQKSDHERTQNFSLMSLVDFVMLAPPYLLMSAVTSQDDETTAMS